VIPKNAHLARLEGAAENLRLFKADMLEPDALAALAACEGVFHVACPVPMDKATDPEVSSVSFTWSNCFVLALPIQIWVDNETVSESRLCKMPLGNSQLDLSHQLLKATVLWTSRVRRLSRRSGKVLPRRPVQPSGEPRRSPEGLDGRRAAGHGEAQTSRTSAHAGSRRPR
jgi:hypothetical protein